MQHRIDSNKDERVPSGCHADSSTPYDEERADAVELEERALALRSTAIREWHQAKQARCALDDRAVPPHESELSDADARLAQAEGNMGATSWAVQQARARRFVLDQIIAQWRALEAYQREVRQ